MVGVMDLNGRIIFWVCELYGSNVEHSMRVGVRAAFVVGKAGSSPLLRAGSE